METLGRGLSRLFEGRGRGKLPLDASYLRSIVSVSVHSSSGAVTGGMCRRPRGADDGGDLLRLLQRGRCDLQELHAVDVPTRGVSAARTSREIR